MLLLDQLQTHRERLEELAKGKPAFRTWVKQVTEMERIVIEAGNMLKLKGDPTIRKLLNTAAHAIEEVDKQLLTNRELTTTERELLFNQKEWNEFFIGLFFGQKKLLKSTERRLKQAIANMKKHGY